MHCTRKITDDIHYVGGSDRRLERFENLFPIERGVSYNSYLILDEKTCLLDTVDSSITRLYLENVKHVLGNRKLDYLVVHHMEPDHCANIEEILIRHPETTVVGNDKTFAFIRQFYPDLDLEGRTLAVTEKAMEELGLMDSGTGMVEERVLRLGQDDDSKEIVTGWYKYDLGLYADAGECFRIYSLLRENGLKPSIQIDGDAIHLSVEYVMAFERENTEAIIRSLGLEPGEAMIAQNPYT